MAEAAGDRMRLTVLGGYLGSGKTTWLRHQLRRGGFGAVHVLVNEAAETPVDDALLGGGATVLAGGCCCCDGRGALVAALRALADRRSRGERIDRLVLETSGLADPGAIVRAVQEDPVLVHHVRLDATIVAVDALHALAQLRSEPLGRRQVAAADRLVVTKTDAARPEALARLLGTLAALNPAAPVEAAVQGVAVPLPVAPGPPEPLPEAAGEEGEPIRPARVTLPEGTDWTAFAVWLSALLHARGDDLVRIKGVVRTPAGRLLLQTVRRVVQQPEILPDQGEGREDGTVVFLGRGYRPEDLARSLRRFAGGA